jgi:hypothetical protein
MSWLKKIVSTIGGQKVEKTAEAVLEAMPTMQCATVAPARAAEAPGQPDGEAADEGPKQRRYFVKKGLFVDNEEERAAAHKVQTSSEEIPDQRPAGLKELFPKLSLR